MNATPLRRRVGLPGAVLLGLGSMVGTGVFVGLGLAAAEVGSGAELTLAIVLAGGLALCNALSSAQLAAAHPVAGGTYAYGRAYLTPWLGAAAGAWFLAAKGASASAAALAAAAYGLSFVAPDAGGRGLEAALGLGLVGMLAAVVLQGIRRSVAVNAGIVGLTVLSLLAFCVAVVRIGPTWHQKEAWVPPDPTPAAGLAAAVALVFVAYTGYGRIATLAEEVEDPRRTIPRAVGWTLGVTILLYGAVAAAASHAVGFDAFAAVGRAGGPTLLTTLMMAGDPFEPHGLRVAARLLLILGAGVAMVGVLMNLLLGLSRVVLAMGRTGDLPRKLARVDAAGTTPGPAVVAVAIGVGLLVLFGSVPLAWTLSAAAVLAYYAVTNAAALRLPRRDRRFPRAVSWLGLLGCTGLAFTLPVWSWATALAVGSVGVAWHRFAGAGRGRS
ncbi:APC family permease [Phycisphaera mikurensis]|nr:APC family permease [Phycisphaera mikurensis]MBB6441878.1 APA family basic amino acid/polyamine antiporter [Phycisphaera mikurensis]